MKKISCIFISLLLGIVALLNAVGCGADAQSELQSKIDELQSRLEKMEDRLDELDKKVYAGGFYTLQEACDNGWLTQGDLMSIAYYNNGGRVHNEEILPEDYAPAPKNPEVLSEEVELKIKTAKAEFEKERYENKGYIPAPEAEKFNIPYYLGIYHSCIAIVIRCPYTDGNDTIRQLNVNGVSFLLKDGAYEISIYIK